MFRSILMKNKPDLITFNMGSLSKLCFLYFKPLVKVVQSRLHQNLNLKIHLSSLVLPTPSKRIVFFYESEFIAIKYNNQILINRKQKSWQVKSNLAKVYPVVVHTKMCNIVQLICLMVKTYGRTVARFLSVEIVSMQIIL